VKDGQEQFQHSIKVQERSALEAAILSLTKRESKDYGGFGERL